MQIRGNLHLRSGHVAALACFMITACANGGDEEGSGALLEHCSGSFSCQSPDGTVLSAALGRSSDGQCAVDGVVLGPGG